MRVPRPSSQLLRCKTLACGGACRRVCWWQWWSRGVLQVVVCPLCSVHTRSVANSCGAGAMRARTHNQRARIAPAASDFGSSPSHSAFRCRCCKRVLGVIAVRRVCTRPVCFSAVCGRRAAAASRSNQCMHMLPTVRHRIPRVRGQGRAGRKGSVAGWCSARCGMRGSVAEALGLCFDTHNAALCMPAERAAAHSSIALVGIMVPA